MLLVGCVATAEITSSRGVIVSGPPPAPMAETRPAPPPRGGTYWVPGYWHWTGMQYAWIPGHWDAPPPGAVWNAPRYVQQGGRYWYEAGGWNRGDRGNAIR